MNTYTIAHYAMMSGRSVITHSYERAYSMHQAESQAIERGIKPINVMRLR